MIYNGRIEDFIPLLDFLANTFGNGIEFTLHDFSKPGKTIIAIRNGTDPDLDFESGAANRPRPDYHNT